MVWVYSLVGIVAALVLLSVWLAISGRRKTKRELRKVTIDDIDPLIRECILTFREKLGLELDLNDLVQCTKILDENINTPALRNAFTKKNFAWYFLKPAGAFLGELVRYHRDAGWQEEEDGSLSIWINDGQEEKTIHPFQMVLDRAFTKKGTVFTSLFTDVFPLERPVKSQDVATNLAHQLSDAESESPDNVAEEPADAEVSGLEKKIKRGANWFFWIAGLSLVNSILFLTDVEVAFFFGLGITQVIDAIAVEVGGDTDLLARAVAFGLDVIAASVFALFGFLSKKERRWAFVVGMILYGLDGTLFLLFEDYLSVGFHCAALYGIFRGCKASWMLRAKTEYEASVPSTSLKPAVVSFDAQDNPDMPPEKVVWPIVIAVITLIYAILYAIVNIKGLSNYWRLAICACLFGGVLGIALKRKGAVILLLIGSALVLLRMVYGIASSALTMSEPPSIAAIVGMLVTVLVFAAWPSFLIVWFLTKSVRTFVRNEWT